MASFTDNVPKFNEYVQTQPIEAMRTAGMMQEQQFQQGISKVQSHIDSLLALPIAKGETQKYVQQRIEAVRGAVKGSISGDFSKQTLTNQIGGLMSDVAKDPIVQNGVQSTAKIQGGIAALEQSKKDGKWSQQNQDYFNESVNKWMGDGDIKTAFEDSYKPWVDYTDRFMKLYKEVNKGEDIQGDAFRIGTNPVTGEKEIQVNPTLKEGISPQKIKSVWNLVSSQPDVQQQLQIDGWSKYKNIDNQSLVNNIATSTNKALGDIQSTISTLQAKLATTSGADGQLISARIEELKQQSLGFKNSADEIFAASKIDPARAKSALVESEMLGSLIGAYSYETMKKSPLWETSMEQSKFDRETKQFQMTYDETVRYHNYQMLKEANEAATKASKEKKPGELDVTILDAPISEQQAKGSASALDELQGARISHTQSQRAAVASIAGINKPPFILTPNGEYEYNIGEGANQYKNISEAGKAAYDLYASANDQYINGNVADPIIKQKISDSKAAYDNLSVAEDRIGKVENKFGEQRKAIEQVIGNISQKINFNGRNYTATSSDLVDVYSIKNNLPANTVARARLSAKYGDADTFIQKNIDVPLQTSMYSPSNPAPLTAAYSQVKVALGKDKNLSSKFQNIEDEYSKMQTINRDKVVTYPTDEPSVDVNIRNFGAIASQVASLNEGSSKGVANDLLETLRNTDKAAKDNLFQSGFNTTTGRGWVSVRRGNEPPIRLDVPASTYFSVFPDQRVNRTFAQRYGARLAIGQGNTAYDEGGEPRTSGYQVDLPKDSPFVVQYHLKKTGPGSNGDLYNMYWWVTPKPTKDVPTPTPIIQERMNGNIPGMPIDATESDVVKWAKQMSDKNWLNDYIKWKTASAGQ